MKRRWMAEGEGWEGFPDSRWISAAPDVARFSFQGGPEITYDASFQDIVPNERIVLVYRMAFAGKPMSVSLATIELSRPAAARA